MVSSNDPFFLSSDPEQMAERLRKPISKPEFFSLALLLSLIGIFTYHHSIGFYQPADFIESYLLAGSGDYSNFYYSYWIVPVFYILEKLPIPIAYSIWASLNLFCAFFASRVFGGKSWLTVLNYQMIYITFYGQITGILLAGLALAWLCMAKKKYHLAGLGFFISAIKPQFGLVIGFIIWFLTDIPWKEKAKILFIPTIGFVITFILYPNWIQNILTAIDNDTLVRTGSISLWRFFGPWTLLFLIPPLLLQFSTNKRILLLITTSMFILPYYQQTGLLALYVLPLGWLPLLSNIGFLFPIIGWEILRFLYIAPLSIYFVIIIPKILELIKKGNVPKP